MERLRMWVLEKLIGRRSVVANVHVTRLDGIIMGTASGMALAKNIQVRGLQTGMTVLGVLPNSLAIPPYTVTTVPI